MDLELVPTMFSEKFREIFSSPRSHERTRAKEEDQGALQISCILWLSLCGGLNPLSLSFSGVHEVTHETWIQSRPRRSYTKEIDRLPRRRLLMITDVTMRRGFPRLSICYRCSTAARNRFLALVIHGNQYTHQRMLCTVLLAAQNGKFAYARTFFRKLIT